jgi:hypothetical protein
VNTPSHLIINAALWKRATAGGKLAIPRSAFLLGAVLPDMPLWLLWAGTLAYHRVIRGDASYPIWSEAYDQRYFSDPLWIAGYNVFHAPALLLIGLGVLWRFRSSEGKPGSWWFWLLAGCLVHSALDIPAHVDDGPLLLFPFEWSVRFQSPVSYWNPRSFGREFTVFELLLDLVLLMYLFGPRLWRRLQRSSITPQER